MRFNEQLGLTTTDRDARIDQLAEGLLADIRAGKEVDIERLACQHPELSDAIRELFPALVAIEQAAPIQSPGPEHQQTARGKLSTLDRIGDFEIEGVLGKGGMGVVYLATDTRLNRRVALKVLSQFSNISTELRRRFQLEAAATAQMQHPNIVPLFEAGIGKVNDSPDNREQYLAMRYVSGQSLDRLFALHSQSHAGHPRTGVNSETVWLGNSDTKRFVDQPYQESLSSQAAQQSLDLSLTNKNRWKKLAEVGVQVADALSHAHGKEILHRDIKPSNLLIDGRGKIWVTDFGLAKFINSDASATADGLVGTLRFMAPERLHGWVDPRSDIYSLGVTLYELATLEKAFSGTDRSRLIANILAHNIPRPSQRVPEIPLDLETILLTAIKREPSHRYATADALREDLQRFCDDKPILARRVSRWEQVKSWAKRNPVVASLSAAIIALLILVSLGSSLAAFQFGSIASELEKEKGKAQREKGKAQHSLLLAFESQAESFTHSRRMGQRTRALSAIRDAVELLPKVRHTPEDLLRLRNEAIVALTLTDIEFEKEFQVGVPTAGISPDFKYYAWSDDKANIHVCSTEDGNELWTYQFQIPDRNGLVLPFFSPDSKYVFCYSDNIDRLRLFDLASGKLLLELENNPLNVFSPVAFSSDSRSMAVPDLDRPIRIFDLTDLTKSPRKIEVPMPVSHVKYFPDDQQLLGYRNQNDGNLFVHNLKTFKSKTIETNLTEIRCMQPVKDGLLVTHGNYWISLVGWPNTQHVRYREPSYIATGRLDVNTTADLVCVKPWGKPCQFRNVKSGRLIFEEWGMQGLFSQQGDRVAIVSPSKLRIYRVHSGQRYLRTAAFGNKHHYFSPEIDPQGKLLLCVGGMENEIWDADSLEPLDTRFAEIQGGGSKFLPDGRIVSVTENKLTLFSVVRDGTKVHLSEPQFLAESHRHGCIGVSSVDNRIAWRGPEFAIQIASLDNLEKRIEVKPRFVTSIFMPLFALSPDGKYLVVADGTIRLFNPLTGDLIHDFGEDSAGLIRTSFCFSPDGSKMICYSGFDHMVFDLQEKRLVRRFAADGYRCGAAWSPDGRLLATVHDQETILLRDGASYEEVARIRTPEKGGIETLRFSPDGEAIFAAVGKTYIFRWDLLAIRQQLRELGLNAGSSF